MPSISVIIPVFNGDKTIKDTIRSVLNQTFPHFELLIINDGSTDSTLDIIKTIDDPRLKILSYPNAGLAASRNRGITQSKGDYISFIDADDLWTEDKLQSQWELLKKNPKAGVAYSWTNFIDESGNSIKRKTPLSLEGNVVKELFLVNFIENGSNVLIRKSALDQVGGFDESLTNSHDWDMWLRLALHYEFVCVRSPQVLYRVYPTSMSGNISGLEKSSQQIIKKAIAFSPETLGPLKRNCLANRYKFLTVKALEGIPNKKQALMSTRLLLFALIYDPSLLHSKVLFKILLKLAVMLLVSSQTAQRIFIQFEKTFNTKALSYYQTIKI